MLGREISKNCFCKKLYIELKTYIFTVLLQHFTDYMWVKLILKKSGHREPDPDPNLFEKAGSGSKKVGGDEYTVDN
jgi:hypothetical protein